MEAVRHYAGEVEHQIGALTRLSQSYDSQGATRSQKLPHPRKRGGGADVVEDGY
jgi:hypothetical protein